MTKRKPNDSKDVKLNNQTEEIMGKIDDFTQKVENKANLILIVPSLVSRLFIGIGSIFTSLGDAFDFTKPSSNRRSE